MKYMPQLDGLRAFAVASVIISHYIPHQYHFGIPFGTIGVQLFFVLSGFLITNILLSYRKLSRRNAFKRFYARRTLRIFPLYYTALTLGFIFGTTTLRNDPLWHIFYGSNILYFCDNDWPGTGSHFWSLSVEEQFYLLWPALILLIPQNKIIATIWTMTLCGTALWFFRPLLFTEFRLEQLLTPFNFDSLGGGALLAFYSQSDGALRKFLNPAVGITSITCFTTSLFLDRVYSEIPEFFDGIQRFSMVLFFVWLIARTSQGFTFRPVKFILEHSSILYLGRISYGLYVWHSFVPEFKNIALEYLHADFEFLKYGITALLINVILTIVVSALSWKILEQPFIRLKTKFN